MSGSSWVSVPRELPKMFELQDMVQECSVQCKSYLEKAIAFRRLIRVVGASPGTNGTIASNGHSVQLLRFTITETLL